MGTLRKPWREVTFYRSWGFHIAIAFAHLAFGGYLISTVKNLHLVVLKCWYPLWGTVSFLIAGMAAMTTVTFPKTSLTYIQRLELTLFCFTFLEIFLSGSTAITAYRMKRLQAEDKDDTPFVPDTPMELKGLSLGPPPSYKDVTQDKD